MTNTRRFFHDRFILFILTINGFLTAVTLLTVLLRLDGTDDRYIQAYRSNLGLDSTTVGGVSEIIAFVLFALGIFAIQIFMALEFHRFRKHAAWVVLILTTVLLLFNVIVANALLNQR